MVTTWQITLEVISEFLQGSVEGHFVDSTRKACGSVWENSSNHLEQDINMWHTIVLVVYTSAISHLDISRKRKAWQRSRCLFLGCFLVVCQCQILLSFRRLRKCERRPLMKLVSGKEKWTIISIHSLYNVLGLNFNKKMFIVDKKWDFTNTILEKKIVQPKSF